MRLAALAAQGRGAGPSTPHWRSTAWRHVAIMVMLHTDPYVYYNAFVRRGWTGTAKVHSSIIGDSLCEAVRGLEDILRANRCRDFGEREFTNCGLRPGRSRRAITFGKISGDAYKRDDAGFFIAFTKDNATRRCRVADLPG
jgi:hypothetical protein